MAVPESDGGDWVAVDAAGWVGAGMVEVWAGVGENKTVAVGSGVGEIRVVALGAGKTGVFVGCLTEVKVAEAPVGWEVGKAIIVGFAAATRVG